MHRAGSNNSAPQYSWSLSRTYRYHNVAPIFGHITRAHEALRRHQMSRQRTNPRVRPTRGRTRVEGPKPPDKLSRLVKRPGVIVGDSDKLADVQTFDEGAWRRKWSRLLPNKGS